MNPQNAERAVCLFGNERRGKSFAADEHDVSERICLDVQLRERVKWKHQSSLVVVGFDRHFGELRLGEGASCRGRQGNNNGKTIDAKGVLGSFKYGYNWYQQVDEETLKLFGVSIPLRGVKINDTRISNTEYVKSDFGDNWKTAHREIVKKPAIKQQIKDVLERLVE